MDALDKKLDILNAARECFARFGYEKTTLDDIGNLVGLNKASLYYYYDSKDALFSEVIARDIEDATQVFRAKIEPLPSCRDKILTYLRERLRYMKHLTNVHHVSMETVRKAQPTLALLFKDILAQEHAFIEGILLKGIEQGDFTPCDTKRVAHSIFTVMDAVKRNAFQGTDARFLDKIDMTAVEEEVAFTVALILDGLRNTSNSKENV